MNFKTVVFALLFTLAAFALPIAPSISLFHSDTCTVPILCDLSDCCPPASMVAHGPTVPPDPWDGLNVAYKHGPTVPPDPWDGITAIAEQNEPRSNYRGGVVFRWAYPHSRKLKQG